MLGNKKAFFYLLLFIVLTLGSIGYESFFKKHYSPGEVLGSTENLEVFVQPEAGEKPVVEAISFAKQEVLMEVYLLSDKAVLRALREARQRGVKVQVMLEQHPFGGGTINQSSFKELGDAGVEVKWSNPTFALTHEKAMVVDGEEAFVLNQNLTTSAFSKNREYNIVDRNPGDVLEVRNIFLADWERKGFGPTTTNLVISPDTSREKLKTFLTGAEKSVDVEMEVIEDREMTDLLVEKSKAVPVRVVAPDLGKVAANKGALEEIKSAGGRVRTLTSPYVHAKVVVVDGVRAYVGSVNFTTASLDQNREVGILVSQSDIIQKIKESFLNDFENGSEF